MTALDLDAIKLRAARVVRDEYANCDGTTWDAAADALTTCPCFAVTVERGEDHARRFGGDA